MVDSSRGAPEVQSACVFPEIGGSRPRNFALTDWVGKRLLAVTHSGLGSLFEIGHWVPLARMVSNDALPERLRRYQGSEGLFVHCSWDYLSDSDADIFVPEQAPGEIELVTRDHGLDVFVGRRITGIRVIGPHRRLYLGLEGDIILRLLPDYEPGHDGYLLCSYTVRSGDHWWSVDCFPSPQSTPHRPGRLSRSAGSEADPGMSSHAGPPRHRA